MTDINLTEFQSRCLEWIARGETTRFVEGYHLPLLSAGLIRVTTSGGCEVTTLTDRGRALVERLEGER